MRAMDTADTRDLQADIAMGTLERGVIASLWQSLESLLGRGVLGVEHAVR